jgi:hypothetical protein
LVASSFFFVKVEYKEKRTPGQIKVAPTIIITAHNRGKWKWKLLSRKEKIKKTMG